MSEHRSSLHWKRSTPDFVYDTYDRGHTIAFEGGQSLEASSAPDFLGQAAKANPEEMLAAALSSCHMLTFLAVAAKSRLTVESYDDEAIAYLEKNASGKMAVTRVILRPRVKFSSPVEEAKFNSLHDKAHHNCFIANSVSCEVITQAVQV
jgi:organic hydroperoxide reductase OsmC/OhrA